MRRMLWEETMKWWKNSNVVHDVESCMTTDRPGSRRMVEVTGEQLDAMLLLYGSIRNCQICTVGLPKRRKRREGCPRCGRSVAVSSWYHNTLDGEHCTDPPVERHTCETFVDRGGTVPSDPSEWLASLG